MDAQIDALGLNNEPPANEVEREIRKLQRDNLEVLFGLDAQILDLENRLGELEKRRNTIQERIHQYQSIISPLRRLSPEILGEIFCQCLPTHRNPIIDARESPVLLTHICSFWRAAAIAEPRIWTHIYITFEDRLTRYKSNVKHQHATDILRRRLDVFKTWLSRSGIRPLSISICFTSILWSNTIDEIREQIYPVTLEFLEFLAQLSPRFEALELSVPLGIYRVFEAMIQGPEMSKLTSLRVAFHYDHCVDNFAPIVFLQAPKLKQVSIWTDLGNLFNAINPYSMSPWREVTDISIHHTLTRLKLIALLEHTPNLVHFKATIDEEEEDNLLSVLHTQGNIPLPFLRTFAIIDKIGPYAAFNPGLYNRIDAPGLTWVEYAGALYTPISDELDGRSIVALLQRLPALQKLTLIDENDRYDSCLTERIFRAVPSITHLFLGYEERSSAGYLVRNPPSSPIFLHSAPNPVCQFDIGVLSVPPSRNGSDVGSRSDLPLLPNLVSLEISNLTLDIQDELLCKFIVNRMQSSLASPSSSSESANGSGSRIAKLKHIGVVFYRPKEIDVASKIQQYAERMGADMVDLFLDYPESPTRKPNSSAIAADYGLRDCDGRSWHHQDVEGFTAL